MCFLILFGDASGGVPGSNFSAIDPLPSPSVSNADDATEDQSVVDVVLGFLRKLQVFAETKYDDFIDWCMDFLGPTRDEFPGLAVNVEVAHEKVLQERALAIDIAPIEDEQDNVNDQAVTVLLPTAAAVAQDPMPALATDQIHVIDIAAMNESDGGDNVAESTTSLPVGVSRSAVVDADLEPMLVAIETSQAAVVNIVQPALEAIPSIAAVLLANLQPITNAVATSPATMVADVEPMPAAIKTSQPAVVTNVQAMPNNAAVVLADPQPTPNTVATSLTTMIADAEPMPVAIETSEDANATSWVENTGTDVEDKGLEPTREDTPTTAAITVDVAADLQPPLEAVSTESHSSSEESDFESIAEAYRTAEAKARASRASRRTVVPLPVRLAYRPLLLSRLLAPMLDGVRATDVFRCRDDMFCQHQVCSDVRDTLYGFLDRFRSEYRRYWTLKPLLLAVAAQYLTVKINDSLIQYLLWELAVDDYQVDQTFARVISTFAIPTVTRLRAD